VSERLYLTQGTSCAYEVVSTHLILVGEGLIFAGYDRRSRVLRINLVLS
jgi:hypothetical protein